jgi:hypothetical protein
MARKIENLLEGPRFQHLWRPYCLYAIKANAKTGGAIGMMAVTVAVAVGIQNLKVSREHWFYR